MAMTPKFYKTAVQWLLGFDTPKAKYPAPWKYLSNSIFSDSRKIGSTGDFLGSSLPRVSEYLRSGEHAFGFIPPATVLIEYHSKQKGDTRVYRYDAEERSLQGAKLSIDGSMVTGTNPINYADRGDSGSGASPLMAIILGEIIATAKAIDLDSWEDILKDISLAFSRPVRDEEDTLEPWGRAAVGIYKAINQPNYINGFSEDFRVSRLSIDDIVADAKRCKPLTYDNVGFPSALRAGTTTSEVAAAARAVLALINSGTAMPQYVLQSVAGVKAEAVYEPETEKEDVSDAERLKILKGYRKELKLDIHDLTPAERDMVPKVDPHYVVPDELLTAARAIKRDWKYPGLGLAPNFILEGDAGSGKTTASIFWAYVFGMPRTKMTMNPTFESANLIGAFYPVFRNIEDWNISESDMTVIKKVKELVEKEEYTGHYTPGAKDLLTSIRRGLAAPEVRSLICETYGIPSQADVAFDPDDAWGRLGNKTECPDDEEVAAAVNSAIEDKVYRLAGIMNEQADKGSVSYQFVMSELLKAFQNGWLVEIQEAASVLRPGVLTELNSLLEPDGRIELPNGTCIHRHPDTIVVITTNRGYAGNVELNESLRDRCMFGIKMDSPSAEMMARRAMARTGMTDYTIALEAARVIKAIESEAKTRCIKGAFGMRSLLAWMLDLKRGDYSEDTFMWRVIYKMTTDDDDVETLRACFRANAKFATRTARDKAVKAVRL